MANVVRADTVGIVDGTAIPIKLRYNSADPFAMVMHFDAREEVTWEFARDLFIEVSKTRLGEEGLGDVVGLGDVSLQRTGEHIVSLFLCGDDDEPVAVDLSYKTVISFTAGMLHVVPEGSESKFWDIDSELEKILANG